MSINVKPDVACLAIEEVLFTESVFGIWARVFSFKKYKTCAFGPLKVLKRNV
jgi:hypothetical protein